MREFLASFLHTTEEKTIVLTHPVISTDLVRERHADLLRAAEAARRRKDARAAAVAAHTTPPTRARTRLVGFVGRSYHAATAFGTRAAEPAPALGTAAHLPAVACQTDPAAQPC